MTTEQEVEAMVLEQATEDYTGLWELVWSVPREAGSHGVSPPVMKTVARLLARGAILLYRGLLFDGDERVVPRAEWDTLLALPASWEEPQPGQQAPG